MLETSRLILRQWEAKDRAPFAALNADSDVMRFFPAPLEKAESDNLADRFSEGIAERGWGFWAVELKYDPTESGQTRYAELNSTGRCGPE